MTKFFGIGFERVLDRAGLVFLLAQGVVVGVAMAGLGVG